MTGVSRTIRFDGLTVPPVNRPRLARYLELPSAARIDPITDEQIRRLDDRRDELLSPWHRAVAASIESINGPWIELTGASEPIEATAHYGSRLRERRADTLVVAAFTIGRRVDEIIKHHLEHDEIFEAFVMKQWAATMTEQARVQLTRALRAFAGKHGRTLLAFDGPGYNGWPLRALIPLLEVVFASDEHLARPIHVTESGVLLPTNSMVIVHAMTRGRDALRRSDHGDERLAQCHRCAMRNCNYRVSPQAAVEAF